MRAKKRKIPAKLPDPTFDPNQAMKDAYHDLRDGRYASEEDRQALLEALLAGECSGWAMFALRHLELTRGQQQRLCTTVARSGDGFILWCVLKELPYPHSSRSQLFDAVIKTRLPDVAREVLEFPGLSDIQHRKLSNIEQGKDPDL